MDTMEARVDVLHKLKAEVSLILQGVYPKNSRPIYHRDICKFSFMTTLFMVARKWSQPICSYE